MPSPDMTTVEVVHDATDAPAKPQFAEIEILEVGNPDDDIVPVPNEFRVNGTPFYTSAEHPLRIEPIEISGHGRSLVEVTVTFIAKSVSIRSTKR